MNRKIVGAVAFSAALAGGGVAGALLGTPSTSGAQEPTTTTAPADTTPDVPAGAPDGLGRPDGFGHGRGEFARPSFDVVAEQLGITTDELQTALRDGQTVADLATANGVDLDALIAAVVADATTRIDAAVAAGDLDATRADELKADLTDLVTGFVNGELRGFGGGHGPGGPGGFGGHGGGFGHGAGLDAAATALGITSDELRTALEGGQTIADVAAANGVDVQTVIDAMVAEATDGITERITNFVNGVQPEGLGEDDGGN